MNVKKRTTLVSDITRVYKGGYLERYGILAGSFPTKVFAGVYGDKLYWF